MSAALREVAFSRCYLDGLDAEGHLLRRAGALCSVYGWLCEQTQPLLRRRLERRFATDLARHLTPLLGRDETEVLAALSDHALSEPARPFAQLQSAGAEMRWEAAHRLGETLDLLVAVERGAERKSTGSYFTPKSIARNVLERAWPYVMDVPQVKKGALPAILDPACGGGAFLVEAVRCVARSLSALSSSEGVSDAALSRAVRCAHGIDISSVAVATAQAALALLAPDSLDESGTRFVVADALLDDTGRALAGRSGFDWIVGNPPWVAFQGRATQPITAELRSFYRQRYTAFSGYPTTHGMFAERATELGPGGVISLLVPSSLADLDGYTSARAAVAKNHDVQEPLLEFGQDAFERVVQPCFGLIAAPRPSSPRTIAPEPGRRWVLEERARLSATADRITPPECLAPLDALPRLPKETFGELGFQSNTAVVHELFQRGAGPVPPYTLALLEGRCVQEFRQGAPRVFLHPNAARLQELKVRLRDSGVYGRVDFVVRQTASFTIAACHGGQAFRNSLIAGYAQPELDVHLLVGLLNSALYRCLHLSRQRDARQATFPQVKLAHLRALPIPPPDRDKRAFVSRLSAQATQRGGLTEQLRDELDRAVFELFGLSRPQAREVIEYLRARAPRALG